MTDSAPQVVFETSFAIEAHVVIGLLDARGIDAVVSTGGHAVFPLTVGALSGVQVAVRAEHAERARRLVADFRQPAARIRDEYRAVEEALEYRFEDAGWLEQALTHRSLAHEDASGGVRDNESLEFLGDAVLGFSISARLFRECPDWDEGQHSKARAALVSTTALAQVGDELGLGDHLLLGRGEERTGGRTKPTLIADAVEAVVAAVYLDGGAEAADRFVERWFRRRFDAVRAGRIAPGMVQDHKSALQEWLQSHDRGQPRYELVGTTGPPHRRVFETEIRAGERVLARGEGRSKKASEQHAAERALAALGRVPEPAA